IALVVGLVFAVTQWVSATFISVELTDIIASLGGLAAAVIMLRFWQPAGGAVAHERMCAERAREEAELGDFLDLGGGNESVPPGDGSSSAGTSTVVERATPAAGPIGTKRTLLALFPYLLVIAVFSLAKLV